jgi:hypothetical protein
MTMTTRKMKMKKVQMLLNLMEKPNGRMRETKSRTMKNKDR